MNPLTTHPQEQGVTYWEHWGFAMGIARHLLTSVLAFAIHAILPFKSIKPKYDLEATSAFLQERNSWIETARATKDSWPNTGNHGSGAMVV